MFVVFKYRTNDELFVDINGNGIFTIGNNFIIMLTPMNVRLMTYMATSVNIKATHSLRDRKVIMSTYYLSIKNSRTMREVFIKFALLLTTVKTKLPRVLGRHFYPLLEPLTFILSKFLEVTVHPLRIVRQ